MVEWDIMYLVYIDGYFLNFSFKAWACVTIGPTPNTLYKPYVLQQYK